LVLAVVILVLIVVLVAGVTLSLAVFTASSQSSGSIEAGDLAFILAPPSGIASTAGMRPGETRHGTVRVTNTKSAGSFTLGFSGIGTSTLASTLRLTVTRTTPSQATLYDGVLATVPTLQLGRLATGASLTLDFSYAWPSDAKSPDLQGQSIPLVLNWNSVS
jgi:predicted ribosomally synthesized peptide with SipW-like signal peptide